MRKRTGLVIITLLLLISLLAGCGSESKQSKLDKKTYEKYQFISINMDNTEEQKEFWFAIDDKGSIISAATGGWTPEFDAASYKGHYLDAFNKIYKDFGGESCTEIGFGFANMPGAIEEQYRTECKEFINKLRPELDFKTVTDDFERAFSKFEHYEEMKKQLAEGKDPAHTSNALAVKTSNEFLNALNGATDIALKNDLSVDFSAVNTADITVNTIDCEGHALILLGTCAADDHYHTIEVNNASSIDISKLDVDVSGLSAVNEEMEPSYVDLFRFNISYKNIALGDLPEGKDASENPLVVQCYAGINGEGTATTVTVRRAQSVEARRRQETEYLWKYFENPGAYHEGDHDSRMKIYTDVELYLDDFDTPSDQDINVVIKETGSLKLSGKINIKGPRVVIECDAKDSVDIRELTINRECMSPDCMKIQCEEGVDEQLTTPKEGLNHGGKGKLMVSISEVESAITVW